MNAVVRRDGAGAELEPIENQDKRRQRAAALLSRWGQLDFHEWEELKQLVSLLSCDQLEILRQVPSFTNAFSDLDKMQPFDATFWISIAAFFTMVSVFLAFVIYLLCGSNDPDILLQSIGEWRR